MEHTAAPLLRSARLDVAEMLRYVIDPELGVNIVDLGLVYDVRVEGGRVEVDLTMTTPACPLSSYITQQIEATLRPLPGVEDVHVELVWSPRWSPAMMAPEVRPGDKPGNKTLGKRQPFRFFR